MHLQAEAEKGADLPNGMTRAPDAWTMNEPIAMKSCAHACYEFDFPDY